MSERPSFQFYPGDWQRNANLRRCSHAERGAWVDIMCLMHDSETYGVLRWPLAEIIEAIHAKAALVSGLVTKGVMKGCDSGSCEPYIYIPKSGGKKGPAITIIESQPGPIWYSSRMVRDEYVRLVRAHGKGAPNGIPMGGIGGMNGRHFDEH